MLNPVTSRPEGGRAGDNAYAPPLRLRSSRTTAGPLPPAILAHKLQSAKYPCDVLRAHDTPRQCRHLAMALGRYGVPQGQEISGRHSVPVGFGRGSAMPQVLQKQAEVQYLRHCSIIAPCKPARCAGLSSESPVGLSRLQPMREHTIRPGSAGAHAGAYI